ncbi:MAG: CYTH domain-containing protein [Bacteroides sp.]
MAIEIERKFLVQGDFKSQAFSKSRIIQGYISSSHGRTVRVRIRDDKGYLTIKGPTDLSGMSRYEWEKEISVTEAQELMKLSEHGVIDKVRYLVRSGKHIFEVDEFLGDNWGLIIAEVELDDENEEFLKPSFVGAEVTGDKRYYNSSLMKKPFKNWSLDKDI